MLRIFSTWGFVKFSTVEREAKADTVFYFIIDIPFMLKF